MTAMERCGGEWQGKPTRAVEMLGAPWLGRPYTSAEVEEIAVRVREEIRDAIADAVASSLCGEYGDFDWIREIPVRP